MKRTAKVLVLLPILATLGACSVMSVNSAKAEFMQVRAQARESAGTCLEETGTESLVCRQLDSLLERAEVADKDEYEVLTGELTSILDEVREAKERCARYAVKDSLAPEIERARALLANGRDVITHARTTLTDPALAETVQGEADRLSSFLEQIDRDKGEYSCPKIQDATSDIRERTDGFASSLDKLRGASTSATISFH